MRLNPLALLLWVFSSCLGYLMLDTLRGAIAGLTIGLGASLFAQLISDRWIK